MQKTVKSDNVDSNSASMSNAQKIVWPLQNIWTYLNISEHFGTRLWHISGHSTVYTRLWYIPGMNGEWGWMGIHFYLFIHVQMNWDEWGWIIPIHPTKNPHSSPFMQHPPKFITIRTCKDKLTQDLRENPCRSDPFKPVFKIMSNSLFGNHLLL